MSQEYTSLEDDYEETLVYIDLEDLPNAEELLAVLPDDLNTRSLANNDNPVTTSMKKVTSKPTHDNVLMKFYNFDSDMPILQVGDRYFSGKYDDAFGSSLLFREKTEGDEEQPGTSSGSNRRLTNLLDENEKLQPPTDPLFQARSGVLEEEDSGEDGEDPGVELPRKDFELIANVSKILKFTRREVIFEKIKFPKTTFSINSINGNKNISNQSKNIKNMQRLKYKSLISNNKRTVPQIIKKYKNLLRKK